MGKMFKCEDGTMFPVSEVLSIKEATTYYDKQGREIKPVHSYSSEKELIDAIPTIVSHPHKKPLLTRVVEGIGLIVDGALELPIFLILFLGAFLLWLVLWIVCIPFRLLLGTTFPRSFSRSCFYPFLSKAESAKHERQEKKWQEERDAKMVDSCRESCYKDGFCRDINCNIHSVKQWDVMLRNQQNKIHIFNSDYEKLCAEMRN